MPPPMTITSGRVEVEQVGEADAEPARLLLDQRQRQPDRRRARPRRRGGPSRRASADRRRSAEPSPGAVRAVARWPSAVPEATASKQPTAPQKQRVALPVMVMWPISAARPRRPCSSRPSTTDAAADAGRYRDEDQRSARPAPGAEAPFAERGRVGVVLQPAPAGRARSPSIVDQRHVVPAGQRRRAR